MSVEFYPIPAIPYGDFVERCGQRFVLEEVDPPRYTTSHKYLRERDGLCGLFVFETEDGNVAFEAFGKITKAVDAIFPHITEQFGVKIQDQYGLDWKPEGVSQ